MENENTEENIETLKERIAQLEAAQNKSEEPEDVSSAITNEQVKQNINKAYQERDAARKEVEELKRAKHEAELRALEEAGKKDEADRIRLQTLETQLKERDEQITKLTRDTALRAAIASLDFVNDRAADIVYQDLKDRLIKDGNGEWVSPIGQSIADYVQQYSQDENNKFLFKAKQSSGSNYMANPNHTSAPVSNEKKPVTQMTTEELLKAAAEGKFDDGLNTWQ